MIVSVDAAASRPIYLQIMDEVRRGLVTGTLLPDEPLPSVRQLAAELRLNPNTVQQAYRELEREGLVYVRRGRGTFAAAIEATDAERRALADEVARRALREAYRHGVGPEDLMEALERAVGDPELDEDKEEA